MCCILACFSARPSLSILSNIGSANRDGFGVMWIDRKTKKTHWRKGLQSAAEVHELTETLPLPFAVHARFATAGGSTPRLTHPFPVEFKPSLALEGATKGDVLMHNGHLGEWEAIARRIGLALPNNPFGWSDTRVIAALVAKKGRKVLKTLGQKFATLSVSRGLEIVGDFHEPTPGIFASSYTGDPFPVFDLEAYRARMDAERAERVERLEAFHRDKVSDYVWGQARRMRESFDDRYGGGLVWDDLQAIDDARERLRAIKVFRNVIVVEPSKTDVKGDK